MQRPQSTRLCENVSASFWGVNFSHVDAISDEFSRPIRLLAILRGERNEFSHSLGRLRSLHERGS